MTNESGDIKVISESGTIKWFSKQLVDNINFMKREGFKVFESPASMEAITNDNVAELAPAKRGRKSNK